MRARTRTEWVSLATDGPDLADYRREVFTMKREDFDSAFVEDAPALIEAALVAYKEGNAAKFKHAVERLDVFVDNGVRWLKLDWWRHLG